MQTQSNTTGKALLLQFKEAESKLKNLKLTNILKAFLEILNLDENSWYLATIECSLIMKQITSQIISEMKKKNLAKYSLSNQVLIRELNHVLFGETGAQFQDYQRLLVKRQVDLLLRGEPFECLDGDNLIFAQKPLLEISKFFQKKRIKSLSILGLQSTGKSTVLNYTFGTSNAHSIGQCTKGMYLSCVKVDSPEFDYLLVIDSEGLGSLEGMTSNQELNTESDNKLILFCLSISQITIINEGSTDFSAKLASLLKNAVANLHELRRNRERPEIFFSINNGQINIQQKQLAANNLKDIIKDLYVQLRDAQEEIQQLEAIIANNNIFLLGQLFHENNVRFGSQELTYKVYENGYSKHTALLGEKVLQQLFARQINDQFNEWISNTNNLWQAISDASNIYQFADLKERKDNEFLAEIVNKQILAGFIFANGNHLYEAFLQRSKQQGYYPQQDREEQDFEQLKAQFQQNQNQLIKQFDEIISKQQQKISYNIREKFKNYIKGICKYKQIQSLAELKTQYQMVNARYYEKIGIQAINDELSLIYEQRVHFQGLNTIQRMQAEKELRDNIKTDFEQKFNRFLIERENELQLDEQDENMFTLIRWGIQMKEMGFTDFIELHSYKSIINSNPNQDLNEQLISQFIKDIIQYMLKSSIFMNELKLASAQRPIREKLSELANQMIYVNICTYFNANGEIKQNYQNDNQIQGLKLVQKQDQDGIVIQTAFTQLYEMIKKDFDWQKMFQSLAREILSAIAGKKFTYELVAQIFDEIVTPKIWQIQDNLAPFCLQLDTIGKSYIQFFAILIIWKKLSYNTRKFQIQFIEQYQKNKSIYLQKLQDKILRNSKGISKNCASKLFEILVKDYSEQYFNAVIQQQLTGIQEQSKNTFTASTFQLQLDRQIFETVNPDRQLILQYIQNPVQTIKDIFQQRWQQIQNQIDDIEYRFYQMVNEKMNKLIASSTEFKDKLKIQSESIESPYFSHFEIIDNESKKQLQNLLNKLNSVDEKEDFQKKIFSKAMFKFFIQFLQNERLNLVSLSGPNYKFLRINIKQCFGYSATVKYTFENLDKIDQEIKGNDEIAVFLVFHQQLSEECQNFQRNLKQLWSNKLRFLEDFKIRLLNKCIGCPHQCPLCSRKCDFDGDIYTQQHIQHECRYGHYIRGMQGILINNRESLSNQTCLQRRGNDRVQIVNNRGLVEWSGTMQQLALEARYKDWNFSSNNNNPSIQQYQERMQNFWRNNDQIFIDYYSARYRLPLVRYQGGISNNTHFILELDDSGSMDLDNRWDKLSQAVYDLIRIQANTNCRFTIRQFSNSLKKIKEFVNVQEVANLKLSMMGGGTNYNLPILDCLDMVNKNRGLQQPEQTVIIFYTDGENNEDLNKEMIRYMIDRIPVLNRQKIQFVAICEMAHDLAFELNEIVEYFQGAGIQAQTCENIHAAQLQEAGLMEFIIANNVQEQN